MTELQPTTILSPYKPYVGLYSALCFALACLFLTGFAYPWSEMVGRHMIVIALASQAILFGGLIIILFVNVLYKAAIPYSSFVYVSIIQTFSFMILYVGDGMSWAKALYSLALVAAIVYTVGVPYFRKTRLYS